MKNRFIKFLLFPLFISVLSGCGVDKNYEIKLAKYINDAYVDEVYDIKDCFVAEEGYKYSANVYSFNIATLTETELEVNDMTFVPITTDDISIVINAKKSNLLFKRTINISVGEHGDPIEDLLITGGYSGFADIGFRKSLNKNPNYKRPGDNNKTSIACNYTGSSAFPFGGTIISPNNFRCLDYWTDKTWANAILRFWCYNDSDYDIEFGFRIKDLQSGVDIDMSHEVREAGHIAAPHAWTEIKLALKPLGVTHTLYINESGTRNDSFNVKVRYTGIDRLSTDLSEYTYNFYLDEIDVVPASNYPEIETSDYNDGWEYMVRDTHWETGTVSSDMENVCTQSNPNSTSSMKISFKDNDGSNPDFVLSPEEQFSDNLPDFTFGNFIFDVKYSGNITDYSIRLKVIAHTSPDSTEWVDSTIVINPSPINDGWYHADVDLSTSGLTYTDVIRLAFYFNGVTSANKSSAFVNIDNIFLVQD